MALLHDFKLLQSICYELEGDGYLLLLLWQYVSDLRELIERVEHHDIGALPTVNATLEEIGLLDSPHALTYVWCCCELVTPYFQDCLLLHPKFDELHQLANWQMCSIRNHPLSAAPLQAPMLANLCC